MRGSLSPRRPALAAVAASLILVGSVLTVDAFASPTSALKYYIPSIAPTQVTSGTSAASLQFRLANSATSTASLGSANIQVPTGFSVAGALSVSTFNSNGTPAGKTWTAQLSGSTTQTIKLRSPGATSVNSLNAGQYLLLDFTANVPCQLVANGTGYEWPAIVKQSNDFKGTNNNFVLAPNASAASIQVTGYCTGPAASIAFVTGPSDTKAGGTMADVTVQVTDTDSQGVSGETVTLASTGLTGSPSATTDAQGVATFSGLTVGTTAGSYTMTASDGPLSTGAASFNVTAGTPVVTFTKQPTDTLVNQTINGSGGVEVTAEDAYGNPVSGLAITLSISPDSFATTGNLTGGGPVDTDASGVATFTGLSIDLSSSGYKLRTDVGGVDSSSFAITSTDGNCTDPCTATLPNGGTVSAPGGTTLIVENNDVVDCGTAFSGFAGTVTIIPSGTGDKTITFVDPYNSTGEPNPQPGVTYPFCKGGTSGTTILDYGNANDRCDVKSTPCIDIQYFEAGSLNLVTKLVMNSDDPPVRH